MSDPPLAAVTGGTGFLGSHVVAALSRGGWRLRLLARKAPPASWPADAETVLGDMADADALARLVDGADAVVHLAALTKANGRAAFEAVNRDGTARLATAVVAHAPRARCILVSSIAAREPGLSGYAASKRAGEAAATAVLDAAPQTAGRWVVLRPSIIYGPGDREGLALRRAASQPLVVVPRAPEPRLTMVHAADVAGTIAALCRAGPLRAVFEVTDARLDGYGWRELLLRMGDAVGRRPRFLPLPDAVLLAAGGVADLWASATARPNVFGRGKVREFLHRDWSSSPARQMPKGIWSPAITLEAGLQDTAAWWATLG